MATNFSLPKYFWTEGCGLDPWRGAGTAPAAAGAGGPAAGRAAAAGGGGAGDGETGGGAPSAGGASTGEWLKLQTDETPPSIFNVSFKVNSVCNTTGVLIQIFFKFVFIIYLHLYLFI